jgi:hypothetical protein
LCRESAQAQVRNGSTSIAVHRLAHENASAMHRITCIGRHRCVPQQGHLHLLPVQQTSSKLSIATLWMCSSH